MSSSALTAPTPFDRRIALFVSPYLIAACTVLIAGALAALPGDVFVWSSAAAVLAGWSAAWSP
jgi:hypothetical protein